MDKQSQETTGIETLKEILELLRITQEYISDRNRTIKPALEEISTTLILVVVHNKIT